MRARGGSTPVSVGASPDSTQRQNFFRRAGAGADSRVRRDADLDPFAASGMTESTPPGHRNPHVVLQLGHMPFGRLRFGKRPRQHKFGLKDCSGALNKAVKGRPHPTGHWMPDSALEDAAPNYKALYSAGTISVNTGVKLGTKLSRA
jgi:hypothetical protein